MEEKNIICRIMAIGDGIILVQPMDPKDGEPFCAKPCVELKNTQIFTEDQVKATRSKFDGVLGTIHSVV